MTRFLFFLLFYLVVNSFGQTFVKDTTIRYISTSGVTYPVDLCNQSCPSIQGCSEGRLYYVSKGGDPSYSCPTSAAVTGGACTAGGSYCSISCRYTCEPVDECTDSRNECESMGGVFSGSVNSGCCIATCDQCGKLDDLVEQKRQMCCNQGLAPPDKARQCRVEARSTCGMNWSTYLSNDNEFSCQDPSVSAAASSRYASECNDKSSSSGGGSSSSGGGSSSSGGSSGSGSDECKECPYLDSILDTLTAQKAIVSNIYNCLTVPGQCGTSSKDSLSIPPWVAEKFDSTLDNQKKEIRELGLIDTSLLKLLDSVHLSLKNDTLTRQTITGGVSSIDSSIGAASDTSKKILRHIAEIMQTNESELARHIDSIISHLPDSVLDSIVKYQKYAIDNFDSAFWGEGNGFTKIDDLTDSAVKYFKEGYRFDSIYNIHYRDSLGEIHQAIGDIGVNIGYALGYGDTAGSTLRGDLAGIKDGIDDLNGKFDGSSVDTGAVGFGNGWAEHGERLADSIAHDVGWKGGLDTVNIDSIFKRSAWDTFGVDSVNDFVNDTLGSILDSLHLRLKYENDSIKASLPDSLTVWADSLIKVSPFVSFDSLIYSTIGARIPNSDQCPEDCQSWSLDLPRFGLVNYTVDFGLCLGRVPLGGLNVLGFLRLIVRLVIVWTCISIVMWTFSNRKM